MAGKRKAIVKAPPSHSICTGGVCDPQRTQGLRAPAPKGSYTLVSLTGPGLFLSANVTKQGGATDLTFVSLDVDGRNVVNLSYAALRNIGLTQGNPYGIQFSSGGAVESFSIGWPFPLAFRRSCELSVTVNEAGVVQIVGNVVRGGV